MRLLLLHCVRRLTRALCVLLLRSCRRKLCHRPATRSTSARYSRLTSSSTPPSARSSAARSSAARSTARSTARRPSASQRRACQRSTCQRCVQRRAQDTWRASRAVCAAQMSIRAGVRFGCALACAPRRLLLAPRRCRVCPRGCVRDNASPTLRRRTESSKRVRKLAAAFLRCAVVCMRLAV